MVKPRWESRSVKAFCGSTDQVSMLDASGIVPAHHSWDQRMGLQNIFHNHALQRLAKLIQGMPSCLHKVMLVLSGLHYP